MLKIGFVGGGKMAQALAKGFISAGLSKGENMIASNHPADVASQQAFRDLGAESITENISVVKNSEVVIIGVKPQIIPVALGELQKASGLDTNKLFLSIAMGVTINQLEQFLPSPARVVRVMPNTPALVRNGASVFVAGEKASKSDIEITKQLLQSVGTCEQVTENYLDPITALSGSGPAYVYIMIEALADGGVKMGLPRDMAYRLASQTVLGAGTMVRDTKTHPGILKDEVTSPAGSTATGLHFLEKHGFRSAVIGAIEAATLRCREISQPEKK